MLFAVPFPFPVSRFPFLLSFPFPCHFLSVCIDERFLLLLSFVFTLNAETSGSELSFSAGDDVSTLCNETNSGSNSFIIYTEENINTNTLDLLSSFAIHFVSLLLSFLLFSYPSHSFPSFSSFGPFHSLRVFPFPFALLFP